MPRSESMISAGEAKMNTGDLAKNRISGHFRCIYYEFSRFRSLEDDLKVIFLCHILSLIFFTLKESDTK